MQPAPRAIDHFAKQRHAQQHQHADNIAGHGQLHQGLRADIGHAPMMPSATSMKVILLMTLSRFWLDAENNTTRLSANSADQRQQPAVDGERSCPRHGAASNSRSFHHLFRRGGGGFVLVGAGTCCALGRRYWGADFALRPVR